MYFSGRLRKFLRSHKHPEDYRSGVPTEVGLDLELPAGIWKLKLFNWELLECVLYPFRLSSALLVRTSEFITLFGGLGGASSSSLSVKSITGLLAVDDREVDGSLDLVAGVFGPDAVMDACSVFKEVSRTS